MKDLINKAATWLGFRICARCGKLFLYSRGTFECDVCIGIIMKELIKEQLATKYDDGGDPDLLHNKSWLEAAAPWL